MSDDAAVESGPTSGAGPWRIDSPGLADMRRHVLSVATLAGLDRQRAQQFTLAVNEIVINAIVHGGGPPTIDVSTTKPTTLRDGDITVTVTDTGSGFDPDVTSELPPADRVNGRGLWLARRMCNDVEINSSSQGTVVRLRATVAPRMAPESRE